MVVRNRDTEFIDPSRLEEGVREGWGSSYRAGLSWQTRVELRGGPLRSAADGRKVFTGTMDDGAGQVTTAGTVSTMPAHEDEHVADWREWGRVGFVAIVLIVVWLHVVPGSTGSTFWRSRAS